MTGKEEVLVKVDTTRLCPALLRTDPPYMEAWYVWKTFTVSVQKSGFTLAFALQLRKKHGKTLTEIPVLFPQL
jgi:hypothetical protein